LFFQDLDLGESLWPEEELRATEAAGKHLSCASHAEGAPGGRILWKIKRRRLEAKRNAITPVTNYN
jgi:hypothetical protein